MYNFIDVTEVSESVVLPSEALKINGEYIENQVSGYRTLNVSGREALSPDVETYTTGIRDGSKIKNRRYPERIITVTYQIKAESNEAFREAYNKLASILNCEEAELIFNDEQDKFFIGTPCIIGEVKPGTNAVVGEFEILCADPFKYSVIEYEAQPALDENSILIDYNGTYKAFPVLEADFHSEEESSEDGETVTELTGNGDCGFVAFFNEHEKIIQMGNPDEVDGENAYAKSQTLVNSVFNKTSSWGTAAKSQWSVNSGKALNSCGLLGNMAMGIASYSVPASPATTSGTLLNVISKADTPNVKYTITAKATKRTANSVEVTLSITAALTSTGSYWYNNGVLMCSVYIGGAWRTITMKAASDRWKSTSGHTKNTIVLVTGLTESTTSLTGIKFKATRSDSLGSTGVLSETACKNLTISKYVADVPETYLLAPSSYGSADGCHGPSIARTIPADASGEVGASDFTLTFAQKFCIGGTSNSDRKQYGHFEVCLRDENDAIVAAISIQKATVGDKAKLRFYVGNKGYSVGDIDVSAASKYFGATAASYASTIQKNGNKIKFKCGRDSYTYKDDSLTDAKVTKITFHFGKYNDVSVKTSALAYNGLYWVKFVKNNCETWKDIPNKFSASDVLIADCRNGEITLNGAAAPQLGALGNDWEDFVLTPGLNQIGFAYSEWTPAEYAPSVKVRYREVFL